MGDNYSTFCKTVVFRPEKGSCLDYCVQALDNDSMMPEALNMLLEKAVENSWSGNLWHVIIADSLLESDTAFSTLWERKKLSKDSLWTVALADMTIYRWLFYAKSEHPLWSVITDFRLDNSDGKEDRSTRLAKDFESAGDAEAMLISLFKYYETYGCGKYSVASGFRIANGEIVPEKDMRRARFDDLIGYEKQKAQLRENTESFICRRGSNNVLLYGDAGTGKSTSIQALLSEYEDRGLRIIEVYKHQFSYLPDILSQLKNRNYSFIILLDDLSFEENETEYKYLKAVMEGGSGMTPDNVRIYATSNRRHLVRESWKDKNDMEHNEDVHRSETMEEKLSLASRFGLQIFYPAPDFKEYQNIVGKLAEKSGLDIEDAEALSKAAAAWQISHGNKSGRTARQFIDSLK